MEVSSTGHPAPNPERPPGRSRFSRRLVAVGAAALAILALCLYWISNQGAQGFRELAGLAGLESAASSVATAEAVQRTRDWLQNLSLVSIIALSASLVLFWVAVLAWRESWIRQAGRQANAATSLAAQLESIQVELGIQKTERRRLEDDVQKSALEVDRRVQARTADLTEAHARLQKELNDRRQAERVMAQQAKELERSKDVLELHVQARTQELQKLQRRYESILNSAGEGIYGLDLQGRTTFVNPAAARITGWKVDELVGKDEREVFHHHAGTLPLPAGPAAGDTPDFIPFYRRDGTSFPAEYVRTPIFEKDKEVGAVVIFKDITERKRAEETLNRKAAELARSNAELEQFAYVASHDLQEPLRKIQAFGDRLKSRCDAVQLADGRDYLERMQNAAARMQTLINDLLTFSRVISTTQPLVTVDLNGVIRGVLGDLEYRIEQTKARIELGDLPKIEADPLQMRQLFLNLIGNALKFQPPGQPPLVRISARTLRSPFTTGEDPYAEQAEITVQDNGIGFDEKYLDKIFAVFQRLHGRNEFEGTGVGLAVCRRITDRHGGAIHAHSRPGEGATFIVTLPTRQAGARPDAESPRADAGRPPLPTPTPASSAPAA